jgi:DNA-binding HxlR family transcriptional regulator
VNACLEVFGDRWSLLIVRDLMLRGFRSYRELQACDEGIATNILADRLAKLQSSGVITAEPDQADGRKLVYRLTDKGIDLAPVMVQMITWAIRHEKTRASPALVRRIGRDPDGFVAELRRRWTDNATDSLLPTPRRLRG